MAENPKSEARTAALRRLREAHAEEYNTYLGEEMGARGIEWTPRLTDEQKAAKQVADLLSQYPELKAQFVEPEKVAVPSHAHGD